jgi:hypothetical protein
METHRLRPRFRWPRKAQVKRIEAKYSDFIHRNRKSTAFAYVRARAPVILIRYDRSFR